jgi:CheY-like chemotaxis protein
MNKNRIVLLADDDDDDRIIFEQALTSVDPSVSFFTSANGCEALERLATQEDSILMQYLWISICP